MKEVDASGGPTEETLKARPRLPSDELVKETEKILLLSYLMGMDHSDPSVTLADDDSGSISFEEALSYMKSRVPLTKTEWTALEPQLRYRAFTVAALSSNDTIESVRQLAIKAVKEGTSLSEFWSEASAIESSGLGKSPWYWETVYRTNMQTVYNAGRAAEFMKTQPDYLELVGIEDARQTDICRQLSGTILPASHPFWKTHWPPFHFGCRTTIRGIYREEVEANREADPQWGSTKNVPSAPVAKGFGGNPLDTGSFYEMTDKMAERANDYGIMPDIKKFAKDIGLSGPRLFNSPTAKDYRSIVPINKEGGSLSVHASYGKKIPKEAEIGKVIAEQGHKVSILPKSDIIKSPDLMIDGEIWEVKTPKSFTSTSLDRDLRGASKQSENVLLNLGSKELTDGAKRGIKDRVLRNGEGKIKKVMVVAKEKITIYTRNEIMGW